MTRGLLHVECEGNIFQLRGELSVGGFLAYITGIDKVLEDGDIETSSFEKQSEIMNLIVQKWDDESFFITFLDDDNNSLAQTKYTPPVKKRKWWQI